MTPRQFFNGLKGKYEFQEQQIESEKQLLFSALRYNASSVTAGISNKLSRYISRYKFPWEIDEEKLKVQGSKFISYDKIKGSLEMVSKKES